MRSVRQHTTAPPVEDDDTAILARQQNFGLNRCRGHCEDDADEEMPNLKYSLS